MICIGIDSIDTGLLRLLFFRGAQCLLNVYSDSILLAQKMNINKEQTLPLKSKVAIVTGGGQGIGREIAIALGSIGMKVCVASRNAQNCEQTCELIREKGGECIYVPTDVTVFNQVENLFERVETELGECTLLVSNAGRLSAIGPTWKTNEHDWWQDVTVNLRGIYNCTKVAVKRFAKNGKTMSRIINMVGGGVAHAFENVSGYACSKAAVMRLTECTALELEQEQIHSIKNTHIKVMAVSPGFVRTQMTEQFTTTASRKYMGKLADMLESGNTSPPSVVCSLIIRIGLGELDSMHGLYLHAEKDKDRLNELVSDVEKGIDTGLRRMHVKM